MSRRASPELSGEQKVQVVLAVLAGEPDHHEAMIYIAMIMNMSRRLARTGDW